MIPAKTKNKLEERTIILENSRKTQPLFQIVKVQL